jgi:hypothetical protein
LRKYSIKNLEDSQAIIIDYLADNNIIHSKINNCSHVGLTSLPKNENSYFDIKYWLILLTLPVILEVYYEVKGERKRKKKITAHNTS